MKNERCCRRRYASAATSCSCQYYSGCCCCGGSVSAVVGVVPHATDDRQQQQHDVDDEDQPPSPTPSPPPPLTSHAALSALLLTTSPVSPSSMGLQPLTHATTTRLSHLATCPSSVTLADLHHHPHHAHHPLCQCAHDAHKPLDRTILHGILTGQGYKFGYSSGASSHSLLQDNNTLNSTGPGYDDDNHAIVYHHHHGHNVTLDGVNDPRHDVDDRQSPKICISVQALSSDHQRSLAPSPGVTSPSRCITPPVAK